MFRIIGDTVEYDHVPFATFLPSVGATQRDCIETSLESLEPFKKDELEADRDEQQWRADQAEAECDRLRERVKQLEDKVYDLENAD